MVKRKLYYTKQGYSYIKCTKEECLSWGGLAICDNCNYDMNDDIYLIYILNRAICKECFNDWVNDSKRYKEDLELQKERQEDWYNAYGFDIEK